MKNAIPIFLIFFVFAELSAQGILFTDPIVPRQAAKTQNYRTAVLFDWDNDGQVDPLIVTTEGGLMVYTQDATNPGLFFDAKPIASSVVIREVHAKMDVDGDGLIDLIVREDGTFEVGWIKQTDNGPGEYTQISNNSVFFGSFQAAADIDQDGDLDFGLNSGWAENADGMGQVWTLHPFVPISLGGNYDLVDVHGDGFPDIIKTTGGDEDEVVLYTNDGNGNWTGPIDLFDGPGSGINPTSVTGDFDGDDDPDLIVLFGSEAWFLNNDGTGEFSSEAIDYLDFGFSHIVTTFDMDNDDDLDIISYSFPSSFLEIAWFENNGDGTFEVDPRVITENYFFDYVPDTDLGDIDQDGDLDILIHTSGFDDRLAWLEQQDNPSSEYYFHSIEDQPSDAEVMVLDFDNDGLQDILLSNQMDIYENRGQLHWFKNIDGTFYNPQTISWADEDCGLLYPGNFNGDSVTDLLLVAKFDDKMFWYPKVEGEANFSQKIFLGYAHAGDKVLIADMDQDGKDDIISLIWGPTLDLDWFHDLNANGDFIQEAIATDLGGIDALTTGYINDDEYPDVIGITADGQVFWMPNDGTGQLGTPSDIFGLPDGTYFIKSGDVDFDGDDDLAIAGNNTFYWFENTDANGSFISNVIGTDLYTYGMELELVDVDQDADLDILGVTASEDIFYFKNLGNGNFERTLWGSLLPNSFNDVALGDINGDGSTDLVHSSTRGVEVIYNLIGEPTVRGACFFDENADGIRDPNEIGLSTFQIAISPEDAFSYSNGAGEYQFYLFGGTYTLTPQAPNPWVLTTTPESYEVTISDTSATTPFEFGFYPSEEVLSTDVYVASEPTRCGFDVDFYLTYNNPGTTINDGYLKFLMDTLTSFNYATPAPDSIADNCLFWFYEDQYPSQSEQVVVNLTMPGVEYLGESLYFLGTSNVTANGQIIFSDGFRYDPVINCSYDPNDKLTYPDLPGDDNFILPDDTLVYTIRFQNTGTDTAFTVHLVDQLDDNLDWSTCQPVAASHPYQMFRSDSGELEFLFEDILLPDSNVNEPASHGFVQYQVLLRENRPEFTVIENFAEIYFDFNPPIITNTTINTLVYTLPQLTIESIAPACANEASGSITITPVGVPPYSYEWSNGDTTATVDGLPAGIYTVTITDADGHINSTEVELINPDPIVLQTDTSPETSGEANGTASVTASGGTADYTYLWNTTPPQTTPEATGLNSGTYTVTVTDANGCTKEAEVFVSFVTSVDELLNAALSIYPNPSNGQIFIEFQWPQPESIQIDLRNALGQLILSQGYSASRRFALEQKDLAAGVYWLQLRVGDQQLSRRIVVQ